MNKVDYFNMAIGTDIVRYKEWGLCLFTAFHSVPEKITGDYNFRLKRNKAGQYITIIDGHEEVIDSDPKLPLFTLREVITLRGKALANLAEATDTTVGTAVINAMLLCYPMGNKIPYINQKHSIRDIEKIIESRFADDVADGETEDPNKIYVHEYLTFAKMACQLSGLSSISVPGDSVRSVTGHPDRFKVRDRLLEQYKDRLNDPVVAAKIEAELVKLDREWLANDPAKDVYLSDKVWKNARKRLYSLHGYEAPFTDEQKGVLITRSLEEGIDFDHLPAYINSLYSGSFSRGSETQLGGAKSKDALRIFQNTTVAEDDCYTRLGLEVVVSEMNWGSLEGMYIQRNSNPVLVTADMRNELMGKRVIKRSPERCNTPKPNYCKICVGERLSRNPTGIGVEISSVGTTYMTSSLKKMHTGSASLVVYNIADALH